MNSSCALRVRRVLRVLVVALCSATAVTLAAQGGPPVDPKATRKADLVELVKLDPAIKLDIRYAGTNNFLGKAVYPEARAFLQRPAAEALLAAHKDLARHGYGLLIHDGYRPWAITKLFWDMTSGFAARVRGGPAHWLEAQPGLRRGPDDVRPGDRNGGRDARRLRRDDTPVVPGLPGRPARGARQARPAAAGHGAPRLHRGAQRVVALQLPGLAAVPDPRRPVAPRIR